MFPKIEMAAGSVQMEAAFLQLDAAFEREGLGKAPEGLCQMLRKNERKPGESPAQMRHRIYSRIYGIMWYGLKIGKEAVKASQPTYVYPESLKAVVRAIVQESIRDYEDPVGPNVCPVTLMDLTQTKWPAVKKMQKHNKQRG